ncbi:MAG: enoyl-CoA hydratase/isomerase family protein [Natronospirillum sp.]|uniref:enoyl-CoA hydratase-related protein n=1 Tax=Natronospirillum sp. TaxID=2812955 RepID=UPI0025E4D026|nr:enoyl-CoA hydratase-related protein [Natronospirillum sp.]MCH8551529.1 enoyl-CoA hydratase/isomerase family protein [Natronospirillum sp.]
MADDFLLQELDERGVLHLIINRPDKRNAFDDELVEALLIELKEAAETPEVKVVQLEGSGDHFSAGADLGWMQRMIDNDYTANLTDARQLAELLDTLYHMPQPTVVLVQGAAFGGAVGLASCCDMVIASDEAFFCLSEVKIGLIPATILPYVTRAIGERQARRYCLSAEVIDAPQALNIGLAHKLVPTVQLKAAAANWTDQVLANRHSAVLQAKDLLLAISDHAIDDELLDETSERIAAIRVSEDGQAGLNAFLQKKKK